MEKQLMDKITEVLKSNETGVVEFILTNDDKCGIDELMEQGRLKKETSTSDKTCLVDLKENKLTETSSRKPHP